MIRHLNKALYALQRHCFALLSEANGLFLCSLKIVLGMFLLLFLNQNTVAQLSPGKLSKAHSKLEGMSNCTQCHTIGDKVSNQKCLACHKELNARVSKNKGFHVSAQVKGKDCITCHSDHHGLNFEAVRFDKKTFNHNLTGYELKGGHKSKIKNCNECHKAENIVLASAKNKPNTFLGLDTKCATCHEDYHQKTLSNDCASCHDFNDFKKAPLFNHEKSDFPLLGAHKKEDCNACHKEELRNGKKFVKYTGLGFTNCTSCHKDVHKGEYGSNCKTCHNEESFTRISPNRNFNHTLTGYTLEGKHREVICKKCHDNSLGNFKEFEKKKNIDCLTCHKDVHDGKLGNDCKSCHNQNSFLLKNKTFTGKFDHNKTDYPLEGKHQTVDCKTCHKKDFTDPIVHNKCMSCHTDKHNGDFESKKDKYNDCATCHTLDGYSPSLFTVEQHNNSKFKLEGAHVAQPCFSCHLKDKKWIFNKMNTECVACHDDIHVDIIDTKYYVKQSCSSCHVADNWQKINFDHGTTKYALKGGHLKASCGKCHLQKAAGILKQTFKGLTQKCADCHKDVHGGQFAKNGVTDCATCHGIEAWDSNSFNHDNTKYKLDGEHKNVACAKCHKATMRDNKSIKLFKIEKYKCIDCHLK
jgi:hypothetical protein